ncbi:heavy metal translocating P-type ATPase [Neomoorella thermoacetica]|uniref:heavy metal translocating P-type ATPase n=2 Tax=Neomoorella thermoacetica TaxID=1525 RepID=UPI0008FAE570|nr:heavy metal translocating P-type ATPase [Moorella thermoacetica]
MASRSKSGIQRGKITAFRVEGITCLDCAAKFERNVAALPGVTRAQLNSTTGRLIVEGEADLEAIRREGKKENYKIIPVEKEMVPPDQPGVNWELVRAALSVGALLAAYIVERDAGEASFFIPLYAAAIVIGGWGNIRRAMYSLPRLDFNMSVLMTIAITGAMAIGEWREGAVVAFLYSVSELLESWTMGRVRRSLRELMDIAPKVARVRRPTGEEVEIPVEEIQVGDIMIVRPGEKIAMDGRIIKGESAINEATITGESVPAEKGPGAEVYAGTLNTYGSLEVEVTKLVQDTTIARIIHLVEEAQAQRAPSQAFVDRFAEVYTPLVLLLAAALVLIPPLFLGYPWGPWIYRGLALIVVACPCALVISTPVAIVSAIGNAARNGVLIKGGIYLEYAGDLKAMAFDKTGTLTKGEPTVTDIISLGERSEQELLQIAANLEARSEHPLAVAVVKAAEARRIQVEPAEAFTAWPGCGARGVIRGQTIYIGNVRLFRELGVATDNLEDRLRGLQGEGKTAIMVGTEKELLGIIAVADEVREASVAAIAALKQAGIRRTVMLTGDNEATARAIAARVGIDEYRAELLPEDKVKAFQELLKQYGKVAMVGDGINDAPALATATVGIAMGGAGTDTALETADIALMADDLTKLPFTIRLSRAALKIIRQNIAFSLAIKAIAVLAVFPGWLTLWLAILGDMGASILVTLNGMRLLRMRTEK